MNNLVDLTLFKNVARFLDKMEKLRAVKNALAIEESQIENVVDSKFAGYFAF